MALALERVREREALSLKAVVNEALRRGLRVMDAEHRGEELQRTLRAKMHGRVRVGGGQG